MKLLTKLESIVADPLSVAFGSLSLPFFWNGDYEIGLGMLASGILHSYYVANNYNKRLNRIITNTKDKPERMVKLDGFFERVNQGGLLNQYSAYLYRRMRRITFDIQYNKCEK